MKAKNIVLLGLVTVVAVFSLDIWSNGFSLSVASYYAYIFHVSIGALFILRNHEKNSNSRLIDLYLWPRRLIKQKGKE